MTPTDDRDDQRFREWVRALVEAAIEARRVELNEGRGNLA